MTYVWKIWRGARFMGTVRAQTAEQAIESYSGWASIPEHELRAERRE